MAMLRPGRRILTLQLLRQSHWARLRTVSSCCMMSTHVSVIGLHWKTDEIQLREVFSQYGTLEDAKIVTPKHSTMHLWASLVYPTFDEALEAVSEMNGQELDGRLLRVSIVDPLTRDG